GRQRQLIRGISVPIFWIVGFLNEVKVGDYFRSLNAFCKLSEQKELNMEATLAATAIGIVGPFLAKGAEEFMKSAGKEAFGAVKALANRLQKWWSGDPVAAAAANNLGQDPQRYGKLLAELLATDLARDQGFDAELRKLVQDVGPS